MAASLDPAYVRELHSLLQQCNVPDTNTVQQATKTLQQTYFKKPSCIPGLFEILSSSPDLAVRNLAAVELRKCIGTRNGKMWAAQGQPVRNAIKDKLLEILNTESTPSVRNAIARVIAVIASLELASNSWPRLLPFLFESVESPQVESRLSAIFVFYTILEGIIEDENLAPLLPQTMRVFSKTLQDPESIEVRITTVRALGVVARNLDADDSVDIATMQNAVPQMVQVLDQALQATHSTGVRQIIDVFEDLAMIETPIIAQHVPDLIQFFLKHGADKDQEEDLRLMCLNSLVWITEYRRKKIQSAGVAKPMIEALLPIATEEDAEDADEDSPSRLALRIIDALATNLPPSHVFPVIHQQMQQYLSSPDPTFRKAALMVFGVSVEGCSEYIRPHMKELWPYIEGGLRDGEAIVRKAACVALGCMCEMLEEECAAKHETLLPSIMELVNDPATQRSACTALDSVLEVMNEEQIAPYMSALMERLSGLLSSAPLSVKATVTGAIGSAAHASKEGFRPYFPQAMQLITPFFSLTNEGDEADLRGVATDAVGTFAKAVGAEAFRPYFEATMQVAFQATEINSPTLRECSYIFFAVMAQVYEADFGQFVPLVVPKLLESLRQAEHDPAPGAPGDGTVNGLLSASDASAAVQSALAGQDDDDDDFVDLEDINDSFLSVNSAIAIEKAVAADALGEVFLYTREAFLPFLEDATNVLLVNLDHFYQGIRKAAVTGLFEFINTLNDLSNPQPWQKGAVVKIPLQQGVQQLVDMVLDAVIQAWQVEDDRQVSAEICRAIAEALTKNGPGVISPKFLEPVCKGTSMILEKVSAAQVADDEDTVPAAEIVEGSEYESALISYAMDVVGALANVLGNDFSDALRQFFPQILKYYNPASSTSDRAAAIGAIGDITVGMESAITPFTNDLLAVLSRGLADSDGQVRVNAAFASGVLVEHSGQDLSAHFAALLTALQPLLAPGANDESDDEQTARDNACGCLSRMIIKAPAAVPLDQALPILFSSLPLKKDMAEWTPVLHALIALVQANNETALQHLDTILQLFAHVLASDDAEILNPALRGQCVTFISSINAQAPEKVQAAGLQRFLV